MSGPPRRDPARSSRGGPARQFTPGLASPVDPLTGLFTRETLETVIRRRATERRRSTSAEDRKPTLTCVLVDLIGLKQTNAREGFSAGDGLLRLAAGRLKQIAPEARLLARLGGD
jgi:diguanylate cyclase (GGDEF)-like protein